MKDKERTRKFNLSGNREVKVYWHKGVGLWIANILLTNRQGNRGRPFHGVHKTSPLAALKKARLMIRLFEDPIFRKTYHRLSKGIEDER